MIRLFYILHITNLAAVVTLFYALYYDNANYVLL